MGKFTVDAYDFAWISGPEDDPAPSGNDPLPVLPEIHEISIQDIDRMFGAIDPGFL